MSYKSETVVKRRSVQNLAQQKPIDLYLTEEDTKRVYDLWGEGIKRFNWQEPITFRGGIKSITCDMVKSVPVEELEKLFYERRTKRILEAIKNIY
jgi:hypothetical protein